MPCNPTQLWTRLSPAWQTRIRADLTALFQEVIDAQLRSIHLKRDTVWYQPLNALA